MLCHANSLYSRHGIASATDYANQTSRIQARGLPKVDLPGSASLTTMNHPLFTFTRHYNFSAARCGMEVASSYALDCLPFTIQVAMCARSLTPAHYCD
jgi:hypothetical protein